MFIYTCWIFILFMVIRPRFSGSFHQLYGYVERGIWVLKCQCAIRFFPCRKRAQDEWLSITSVRFTSTKVFGMLSKLFFSHNQKYFTLYLMIAPCFKKKQQNNPFYLFIIINFWQIYVILCLVCCVVQFITFYFFSSLFFYLFCIFMVG